MFYQSVQMLLAFLVLVLIGARFYLKLIIQRKSLEATDYLIFAAWLCAVASTSADIAMLHVNMPFDTLASFANYEPDRPETFVFILKVRDWLQQPHKKMWRKDELYNQKVYLNSFCAID